MSNSDSPQERGTGSERDRSLEAVRFDFEKRAEERRSQLQEKSLKQARVDTWARLFGTFALGVLVTGGVQCYGIRQETEATNRATLAEANQKEIDEGAQRSQMVIQLTNAREGALSDLRARMFEALLNSYFHLDSEEERIAVLALIGLNFRDAVQIKPMFELLDWQFANSKTTSPKRKLESRKALRSAGRSIIRDQLNQIRQSTDGAVCHLELRVKEVRFPECLQNLAVELIELDESSIRVRTNTKSGAFLDKNAGDREGWDSFTVTYFDMPMVDYTTATSKLGETTRYSIVLSDAEKSKARIAVAVPPRSAVNASRRYAFDDLLEGYLSDPVPREE